MELKDQLKAMAEAHGMTFKELALRAGLSENNLHNKLKRNTIRVQELSQLLKVLGKTIEFKDKK